MGPKFYDLSSFYQDHKATLARPAIRVPKRLLTPLHKTLNMPSHYTILEISKDATPDQIRKAISAQLVKAGQMAETCHPREVIKRFEQLAEAFRVLEDPFKKVNYDIQLFINDDKDEVTIVKDNTTESRKQEEELERDPSQSKK